MADPFWVHVPRDFVRVSGPDAASFLQGQISQDIEAVRARGSAWSFLLQPQGKVDAWVRVSTHGDDEYVLDVETGFGEAVTSSRSNGSASRSAVTAPRLSMASLRSGRASKRSTSSAPSPRSTSVARALAMTTSGRASKRACPLWAARSPPPPSRASSA
jgi:hypothetical protein